MRTYTEAYQQSLQALTTGSALQRTDATLAQLRELQAISAALRERGFISINEVDQLQLVEEWISKMIANTERIKNLAINSPDH